VSAIRAGITARIALTLEITRPAEAVFRDDLVVGTLT
jgi:hypothetical protein